MSTNNERDAAVPRRWARLRFSILGPLLAAPPEHGELRARIEELAAKPYQNPTTGEVIRFGASTIERGFYTAKDAADPVAGAGAQDPVARGHAPGDVLEGEPELSLALLNQATQAWAEEEYHRRRHDELKCSPLEAALADPSLMRPSPSSTDLRRAFRILITRAVRRPDATCTLAGIRFELPWRYRTLTRVTLRVARGDLSAVDLVDPRSGAHLATLPPLDKTANADGRRRTVPATAATAPAPASSATAAPSGIAPHLRQLMADYAATGLPPAYLPKHAAAPLIEIEDDEPADDETANPDEEPL